MKLRKATLYDLNLIYSLEKKIFSNPWARSSVEEELNRQEDSLNLIAEIDNNAVGYFFSHLLEDEAHILNIAMDLPYQNKGYGRQFFKKIMDNYLQYANVYLEVKRSNFPAINLYLHFGFEEIDIRKGYYHDGEDALIMVKKVKARGLVPS